MGRELGVTDEELAAIPLYQSSDCFSALDRLVMDLAVAMSATPATVSDELRARLREHLSDTQLTELAATIAWENHRARFNRALDVRALGFSDGAFCLLPERP